MSILLSCALAAWAAFETPTLYVPWSDADARNLERWLASSEPEAGVRVLSHPEAWFDEGELNGNCVVLGYYRSELTGFAQLGQITAMSEAAKTDEERFPAIFHESWAPVLMTDAGELPAALDSYEDMLQPEFRRRLRFRSILHSSPEALVLGEIALLRNPRSERALHDLIRSLPGRAIAETQVPIDQFLLLLPPGAVTLAPVRTVVRARREGAAMTYRLPDGGFLALPLGLGLGLRAEQPLVQLVRRMLRDPSYSEVCRLLELEPALPAEGDLPRWIERFAPLRREVRPTTEVIRQELAEYLIQDDSGWVDIQDQGFIEALLDWMLILGTGVFLWFAWRWTSRGRSA